VDEYFNIVRDDIPVWYDLDITEGNDALLIHMHQFAFNFIQKHLLSSARTIEYMENDKELELPSFISSTEKVWGFGKILRWVESKETNWHTLKCPLPAIFKPGGKICWKQAFHVSATLNALFVCLLHPDLHQSGSENLQLLIVDGFHTAVGIYGGALTIALSKPMIRWVSKQPHESYNQEITDSMQAVYENMWQKEDLSGLRNECYAHFSQPKWVNLNCPGNSCGLDPQDYYDGDDPKWYRLIPHNTDSPMQQLILLSGFAKMNQLARKAGY